MYTNLGIFVFVIIDFVLGQKLETMFSWQYTLG